MSVYGRRHTTSTKLSVVILTLTLTVSRVEVSKAFSFVDTGIGFQVNEIACSRAAVSPSDVDDDVAS